MKKTLTAKYYTIEIVMLAIGLFLARKLPFIFKQDEDIENITKVFQKTMLISTTKWKDAFILGRKGDKI